MKIARFALLFAACTGTDSGNPPVIDFRNSACHDQSYQGDKDLQSLAPDARYKGLTCVVSERHPDALHLYVSNYAAACAEGVSWAPRIEQRNGGIDLILEDDTCQVGRCGTCLYDLDFVLPPASGEVHLYQQGCGNERHEIAAPLEGTACDYTSMSALVFRAVGDTGERMLCGDGPYSAKGPCDPGLTCTQVNTDPYGRCLRSCKSDTDCDTFSTCSDNVCKLNATGLVKVP